MATDTRTAADLGIISSGADKPPIRINPAHRGRLHDKLGIARGRKIPAAKLAAAKRSSDPEERKEATFAINFAHARKARKRG